MKRRLVTGVTFPLAALVVVILVAVPAGQAQGVDPPDWVGNLTLANNNLVTLSSPTAQEELPGLGHKFEPA